MAELKTKPTEQSVDAFLDSIADAGRQADCRAVLALMKKATKAEPKMWGPSIVGLGDVHLKYESGRELDWFAVGFAPRKGDLTLYGVMPGIEAKPELAEKLGKFKTGKGCLYIKKMADVDADVLRRLIEASVKQKGRGNPEGKST
jgi:hypothetical protein